MPHMNKPLALAVLIAMCACASAVGCKPPAAKTEPSGPPAGEVWLSDAQIAEAKVKTQPLAEQLVDDVIVTSGKVAFEESRVSHVFSPVSGRIIKVEAKTGQRVKKGDALAVVESPDVGIASSDVEKAQSDVIQAEHAFQRQKELLNAHATSQKDYEDAEDAYRKARAELDRARQKTSLFRGAAGSVSQTYVVRSPIEGEVISRNASDGVELAGQYGGAAVELFTIGELDKVWVIADVYEIDSARVKVGSKVNLKLFAFPTRVFPATIDYVSGALDAATRTARVRCVLDNPDRTLKPEMYATLFISVEERKALAIPRASLLRLGDQLAVFVEKGKSPDGRHVYARTPVAVDESEGGDWLPIAHGIEEGMPVVVEGGILLSGGTEAK
jgi:cobalt-zinc-cadmium efflux system membrane fusion protein